MNSRLRPRVSSVFAFIASCLAIAAVSSGCGAADEEELDQMTSEHRKKNECRDYGYDVKPLGDREKKMLDDYHHANWRWDKGGVARKDGRSVMGAPGSNGKWIFCVKDGEDAQYQIVENGDVDTNDIEVALALAPQHNKYPEGSCEKARDYEQSCAKDRQNKSYDTKCALTAGLKWAEAKADADKACAAPATP
jgi:hypothetical protein